MKLSHLTVSLLVLGATIGIAQDGNKRPVNDSTKVSRNRPKNPKHSAKTDTLKTKKVPAKITRDYCPTCGMG